MWQVATTARRLLPLEVLSIHSCTLIHVYFNTKITEFVRYDIGAISFSI